MVQILICGLDEAGRGALIGPMVICGVVIDKKDEKKLKELGVRDSKTLTPKKREILAKKIEKIARSIIIMRIPACKIFTYRRRYKMKLDALEAFKMAQIIDICNANKVYVDSLGNINSKRVGKFEKLLRENLNNKRIKLIVENYADETYPVVSAASIIAKVERDKAIDELKKRVKFDFGVGYSHDPRSIEFLKKVLKESREPPSYIRWHWDTVESIATKLFENGERLQPWVYEEILGKKSWQKRIKDFFKKREKCKEGKG